MDGLDTGGFTGDQTGMGQGLAYVLPQSRTVGYFMQLANEKAQQRRDDADAIAQAQQKQNDQYAQHLYQFKTPEIANEYTKWLQPKFDDLISQAAEYHSKTGEDPFTNPDFVKKSNQLNTVAKSTDQANKRAVAIGTALADKSKNYTNESKQANIDWLQKYHADPVGLLYTPPPPLEERNLDLNDAVKLGHANAKEDTINGYNVTVPDRHGHIVQAQTILSQPEFAPLLEQNGINPHVGDIGGIPNGTGGTIYPTDAPHVNAIADQILQNAAQPHFAATLQAANISPLDPHAKDKLTELIQRQNAGYGKVYSQFADRLDANIGTKNVRNTAEERLGLSEANLSLAQQRLAFQQEKEAKKGNSGAAIAPEPISSIPYATQATDEDGKTNGGFNIGVRNFVPVKSSNVAFGANPDIDLTNGGKPKGLSPLSAYKIAGVGDVPMYSKTTGSIQAGTPVRPQDADVHGLSTYKRMVILEGKDPTDNTKIVNYLMDYNKIPANVKNTKSFKEAIAQFEQTPVYGSPQHKAQQQAPAMHTKINPQALQGWNQ